MARTTRASSRKAASPAKAAPAKAETGKAKKSAKPASKKTSAPAAAKKGGKVVSIEACKQCKFSAAGTGRPFSLFLFVSLFHTANLPLFPMQGSAFKTRANKIGVSLCVTCNSRTH